MTSANLSLTDRWAQGGKSENSRQTPLYRARALKPLKLVLIQHQQFDGRGGQIRWNVHGDPTASDVTEMLYGMGGESLLPLPWPATTSSSAAASSRGRPRPLRASGLASDAWVITIITREVLEEAAAWQRPLMFNRIFGCFIDFNSAAGAGERRPAW